MSLIIIHSILLVINGISMFVMIDKAYKTNSNYGHYLACVNFILVILCAFALGGAKW